MKDLLLTEWEVGLIVDILNASFDADALRGIVKHALLDYGYDLNDVVVLTDKLSQHVDAGKLSSVAYLVLGEG